MSRGRASALTAIALVACACAGAAGAAAARTAAGATRPAVALSARYDDGAGHVRSGRLTCDAKGQRATGALAGRVSAARQCARVRALRGFLTHAPPAGRICTQIYGGPQTLRVTGRIGGSGVHRRFTRTNGCRIADFARAVRALPIAP